ncbi:MAG: tetratricopeptide repeat protein [Bacteroidetes bacterium]|nr:tetratricopeptide repeat protein [Bacteroidota bacterium]
MKTRAILVLLIIASLNLPAQQASPALQVKSLIENYQYKEAVLLAEQQLSSDTTLTEIILLEGEAMSALFRFKEAENLFLRAWHADSSNLRIMNKLAGLYRQTGETEQAVHWYKKILAKDSLNESVCLQLAAIYSQTEDNPAAFKLLIPLYSYDSTSFYLLKQIGNVCQDLRKPDSALLFYYRALRINPADAGTMVKAANILIRHKDYDSAVSITARFMKENTKAYSVMRLNAYATYLLKDYPGSAERFRRSMRMGDNSKFTLKYLGLCRYKLEMYDSAVPSFRKAYVMDTTDVEVCFYYGVSAMRSFSPDTGLCYLQKTMKIIMPSEQFLLTLYAELAGAYNLSSKPDTALEILLKAHNTDQKDPAVVFKIAYQYDYYLHKPLMALPWYEAFMKMKPTDSASAQNLPQVMSYSAYARNRIKELKDYNKHKAASK